MNRVTAGLSAMRGRLFWKILSGFAITFFLMVEALWLLVMLYGEPPRPVRDLYTTRIIPGEFATAAMMLRQGGLPAFDDWLATQPAATRAALTVTSPAPGTMPRTSMQVGRDVATLDVVAADGAIWRLSRRMIDFIPRPPDRGPLHIPPDVMLMGAAGGLLFSAVLAWYLTRPILRLRDGFERLARGELSVRLGASMGRRRDELADLARDFDVMAARLQQTVSARDRLLHDVSHELRSPLARLQMAVGLVRQSPARIDSTLARLDLETARLNAMVGELLTLSRVESDMPRHEDYVDLHGLVASVTGDARFEAGPLAVTVESRITPAATLSATGMIVKGSAELLRRAIENVIRNALRFSPPGGTVLVTVGVDDASRCHVLTVADSGPGVAPELLATMFDPFVRGVDGTAAAGAGLSGQGYGLGLAIARRTIEAHGGSITARNRPEGGLAVVVILPWTMEA
ncbi:sensor histidine kinase [Tistrella bauzanensis]|uniref:histidine kinase n=1 Tax=Tistrella bauzanensis TaxID=657419 RepID=A0ABQ1ITQ3_9PROT|nr:ATP-binding protein [Tistrella bauzanensis]GGB51728.1 sensor histidine kinase [Tistrella bauzanensis]